MGTSSQMLAAARVNLGLRGRPNVITRDYASRNGSGFLSAAWCDMSVTYWARKSGNQASVLPAGDRAYTVWHAQDFQRRGHWFTGTRANVDKAKPGDVVFFDWGATNNVGAIDHVGVVERVLGDGRVQTIEGNTSDMCARRVRSYIVIAGLGRPQYDKPTPITPPKPGTSSTRWPYKAGTLMRRGWSNSEGVKAVQRRLNELGAKPKLAVDGDFGPATAAAVKAFQRSHKLEADSVVGPKTWAALFGGKQS